MMTEDMTVYQYEAKVRKACSTVEELQHSTPLTHEQLRQLYAVLQDLQALVQWGNAYLGAFNVVEAARSMR